MAQRRTLVLTSETLTELTPAELGGVAGGNTRYCVSDTCHTWGDAGCFSRAIATCDLLTGGCA